MPKPDIHVEPSYLVAGELQAGDLFVVLGDGGFNGCAKRIFVKLDNIQGTSGIVHIRTFGEWSEADRQRIDIRYHTPVARVEVLEMRVRRIL